MKSLRVHLIRVQSKYIFFLGADHHLMPNKLLRVIVCFPTYRANQIEDKKNVFHQRHSTPHFGIIGFESLSWKKLERIGFSVCFSFVSFDTERAR